MFNATAAAIYSLGHGLRTFTAVLRSTQPYTVRGMVKRVSAYGLTKIIAAKFRRTDSPSHLAWSGGWRPPGA